MTSVLVRKGRERASASVKALPHGWALSLWARGYRRLARPWVVSRHVRNLCRPFEVTGLEHLDRLRGRHREPHQPLRYTHHPLDSAEPSVRSDRRGGGRGSVLYAEAERRLVLAALQRISYRPWWWPGSPGIFGFASPEGLVTAHLPRGQPLTDRRTATVSSRPSDFGAEARCAGVAHPY